VGYVNFQFVDPEGNVTYRGTINTGYSVGNGSSEQIESLARFQSKNFWDRIEFFYKGKSYYSTPMETKMNYDLSAEAARWCFQGDHAFSPFDKARKRMAITQWNEDSGEEETIVVLTCGPCAKAANIMQKKPIAEIAAPTAASQAKADAELYAEFLEWKNNMRDEPLHGEGFEP
jgi:hypothetical protein